MTELHVQRCRTCDSAWFPDRLRCPRCGSKDLIHIEAGPGTVERKTALRDGAILLAEIRLDAGAIVIARLEDKATRVRLQTDNDGAIWARHA